MAVDELLQQRRIYRQDSAPADVRATLDRAAKDLASAEHILSVDHGSAFSITYNAVLHAVRAVMFANSFRPAAHESHKNAFAFLRVIAEGGRRTWVDYFDRMRVKRHEAVYETAERISRTEAEALIDQARDFIAWARQVTIEWVTDLQDSRPCSGRGGAASSSPGSAGFEHRHLGPSSARQTPVKGEQRWRGHPVGPREQRAFRRIFYTPYWTTCELPSIDMKAASVGILDQIVAGLRQWSLRKSRRGSLGAKYVADAALPVGGSPVSGLANPIADARVRAGVSVPYDAGLLVRKRRQSFVFAG